MGVIWCDCVDLNPLAKHHFSLWKIGQNSSIACKHVCVYVNHLKRCKTSITVVPFHLVSYIKYLEQGGNPMSIAGSRTKRAMQRLIRSLIYPMYLRLFSNLVSFHCNGAGLSREPFVLFCTVAIIIYFATGKRRVCFQFSLGFSCRGCFAWTIHSNINSIELSD